MSPNLFKPRVFGSGLLARSLADLPFANCDAFFFAAGVSNSVGATEEDYERELCTLQNCISDLANDKLVYFSSFVALEGSSRYADHKRLVERLIAEQSKEFLIIRLPQVVGEVLNSTLVSYFVKSLLSGTRIHLQQAARRRLIAARDVARIVAVLTRFGPTGVAINVGPPRSLTVAEILLSISRILNVQPDIRFVDGGDDQSVAIDELRLYLDADDVLFSEGYQNNVLEEYVPLLAARYKTECQPS